MRTTEPGLNRFSLKQEPNLLHVRHNRLVSVLTGVVKRAWTRQANKTNPHDALRNRLRDCDREGFIAFLDGSDALFVMVDETLLRDSDRERFIAFLNRSDVTFVCVGVGVRGEVGVWLGRCFTVLLTWQNQNKSIVL